jgi:hypothetical protein
VLATKVCGGPCGRELPLDCFYSDSSRGSGIRKECKECKDEYTRLYILSNPAARLYVLCKCNARARGIKFCLDRKWFEDKVAHGKCELTGISFVYGEHRHPFGASVDRIDSNENYSEGNCRLILWMLNAAKGACPESAFITFLRQVAEAVVERL